MRDSSAPSFAALGILEQDRTAETARPAVASVAVGHIASIDALRIVAVIGVVWFHTDAAPHRLIGYAGLPIFLLVFFSLIVRPHRIRPMPDFARQRWNRLLKPWLFWSAVYGLCILAKAAYTMDFSSVRTLLSPGTLLQGPCVHLWYLPFAFIAGFVVYACKRWTSQLNTPAVILTTTTVGLLVLIGHALGFFVEDLARPLPQWEFGLPAIPLGIAIGTCLTIPSGRRRSVLLLAIVVATLTTCMILKACGRPSPAVPYGLATGLVCLAYTWRGGHSAVIATLAPLTFGIYLIHPLVAFGLQPCLAAGEHPALFIAATTGISGLVTAGVMQTPLRKFV